MTAFPKSKMTTLTLTTMTTEQLPQITEKSVKL